jgi:protein-L-isoaspartate(D-aspartate) O-methyltransferase
MEKEELKYTRRRERMVENQLEARGITDSKVLWAMHTVPRHLFVSDALRDQAYGDFPLPVGEQQTISQPYIVGEMTQALELNQHDRVLELGTGSGYQAAVLAQIVDRVYTIERIRSLYQKSRALFDQLGYYNIVTRYTDGTSGWPEEGPFDAIIVTAGAPEIPSVLIRQLAPGGRLVAPIGTEDSQKLVKLYNDPKGMHITDLGGCRFVKLIGRYGWQEN